MLGRIWLTFVIKLLLTSYGLVVWCTRSRTFGCKLQGERWDNAEKGRKSTRKAKQIETGKQSKKKSGKGERKNGGKLETKQERVGKRETMQEVREQGKQRIGKRGRSIGQTRFKESRKHKVRMGSVRLCRPNASIQSGGWECDGGERGQHATDVQHPAHHSGSAAESGRASNPCPTPSKWPSWPPSPRSAVPSEKCPFSCFFFHHCASEVCF